MPDPAERHHAYTLVLEDVAVGAAAVDLIAIRPATGKRVALIDLRAGNVDGRTAAGDATEEFGRWSIVLGHDTDGTGGSVLAARRCNPDGPAADFTARGMDTGLASGGSPATHFADNFPSREGIIYRPRRLAVQRARPDDGILVVRLLEALDTPFRASIVATVVEYERGMWDFVRGL